MREERNEGTFWVQEDAPVSKIEVEFSCMEKVNHEYRKSWPENVMYSEQRGDGVEEEFDVVIDVDFRTDAERCMNSAF